ncbi:MULTISPECIES: DUF302 domain-containing protein [Halothiobacillus]|jgi:uncharacterized protein (DUF302 family)|uniref:DUF302 domain-containing protein n=1 Tax=Halothiobacillus TaxID=109262 RepID=UPI000BCBF41D|nr:MULTISPECIES: DUF302 domain-containing protein [Halothiobacillus]OYY56983.1 MAG: hypothetical protein B7Y53_00595 [Halothiobacillus sp. 28-55-5]OZB35642.1 MAG: hypothetical protein B7X44_09185 [Halothiobacillus sp. 15-55-196]TDN57510.1 uncharacterized protein (DUF302 family) [Halothiobacillus neapolitanus]
MRRAIQSTIVVFCLLVSGLVQAAAHQPMIKETSPYSVHKTMDRLVDELNKRHIRVFARIDYQANAEDISVILRPETLLIFSKVSHSTQLVKEAPMFGVYMPMRVLAWQDATGQVWIGYNDITKAAPQYDLSPDDPTVQVMSHGLALLCNIATGREEATP